MTAVETMDVAWVHAPDDGELSEGLAVAPGHRGDRVAAPEVHQDVARRELGISLASLMRRMSPPARYRMIDSSAGGWNFRDWESLMDSISYLREMGFDMSTLRVELLAPEPAPQPAPSLPLRSHRLGRMRLPATALSGRPSRSASRIRRPFGALDPAA
jgi:hypothetical protein